MKLSKIKDIYKILSECPALKKVTAIAPVIAEEGTAYPFIVYRRMSVQPAIYKWEVPLHSMQVEVSVVATSYEESITLADAVIDAMTAADYRLTSASEGSALDYFNQDLTFEIEE